GGSFESVVPSHGLPILPPQEAGDQNPAPVTCFGTPILWPDLHRPEWRGSHPARLILRRHFHLSPHRTLKTTCWFPCQVWLGIGPALPVTLATLPAKGDLQKWSLYYSGHFLFDRYLRYFLNSSRKCQGLPEPRDNQKTTERQS